MSVTAKPLILTQYAPNAATTKYTTPSGTNTIIDKFSATNVTGSAATLTLHIVTNGNTVGDQYKILDNYSIAANTAFDVEIMRNQILTTGDFIVITSDTSSAIVVRASGREIT